MKKKLFSALSLLFCLSAHDLRADWEHLLGPTYDSVCHEKEIQAGSVEKVWETDVGTGFSAVTVSNGRAYTMGNDGGSDHVVCLDAVTGRSLWRHSYPAALEAASYEGGPNATPTIADGRVYVLGRRGQVACLDAADGKVVWQKTAAGVEPPTWGFSGAPTVVGDSVVLNVGPRGLALNKDTGAVIWSSSGPGASYATPVPAAGPGGGVVLFPSAGLMALDPRTGSPQWTCDWSTSFEVNAASPTPVGSGWFVSTGYGTGCALVDVTDGRARTVWRNRNMCSHFNTSAFHDGAIFGIDGNSGGRCSLVALSAADGKVLWKQASAFGTLRLADGKLFFLSDDGMLSIADASPKAYQERGRHRVSSGTCWTVPTITGKKLYVRNGKGRVGCWRLDGGALTVEPRTADKDVNLAY